MRFFAALLAVATGTQVLAPNVGDQMNRILEKQIMTLEAEGQAAAVVWAKESCECKGIVDAETARMTKRANKMSETSSAKKEAQSNYNEASDLEEEALQNRDDDMEDAAGFEGEKREMTMTLSKSIAELQTGASLFQQAIRILEKGMSGNESEVEGGSTREDQERARAYEKNNKGNEGSGGIVETLNDMMTKMKELATEKRQDLAQKTREMTSSITTSNNSAQEQDNEAKEQRKIKNSELSTIGAEQEKYTQYVATFFDSQKNLRAANKRCQEKRAAWKAASDTRHNDLQEFHKMHYTMNNYVIAQISGSDAASESGAGNFLQMKGDCDCIGKKGDCDCIGKKGDCDCIGKKGDCDCIGKKHKAMIHVKKGDCDCIGKKGDCDCIGKKGDCDCIGKKGDCDCIGKKHKALLQTDALKTMSVLTPSYTKAHSLLAVVPKNEITEIMSAIQAQGPLDKIEGLIKEKIEQMETDRKNKEEHAGKCKRELAIIQQRRDAAFENRNDAMASFQAAKAREIQCINELNNIEKEHDEAMQNEHSQQRTRIIEHKYISKALEKSKNASNAIEGFKERASSGGDKQGTSGESNDAMNDALTMLSNDLKTHQKELTRTDDRNQKAFDALVQANKEGTAKRTTFHAEMKSCISDKKAEAATSYGEYKNAFKDLDVALKDYDVKLNKECKVAGVSYEERVAAREAEIAGLKAALKALK